MPLPQSVFFISSSFFFSRRNSAKLLHLRLMMAWLCNLPGRKENNNNLKPSPVLQTLLLLFLLFAKHAGFLPTTSGAWRLWRCFSEPVRPWARRYARGHPWVFWQAAAFCGSAPKKTHRQQMACVVFRPAMRLSAGSGSPKPAPLSL